MLYKFSLMYIYIYILHTEFTRARLRRGCCHRSRCHCMPVQAYLSMCIPVQGAYLCNVLTYVCAGLSVRRECLRHTISYLLVYSRISSYRILCDRISSYAIPSCSVLSCPVLSYRIVSNPLVFCRIQSCGILS